MSDEGMTLKAEHVFLKIIWRGILSSSKATDFFTTWSITGVTAITGLLITNIDTVGQLVSRRGLLWAIILFTASILLGALSKHIGVMIVSGLMMIEQLESQMGSKQVQDLMTQIITPPQQMIEEMVSPFWWPLSWWMRKKGMEGLTDPLTADKMYITFWHIHAGFVWLHTLCGIGGFVVIAVSILL